MLAQMTIAFLAPCACLAMLLRRKQPRPVPVIVRRSRGLFP